MVSGRWQVGGGKWQQALVSRVRNEVLEVESNPKSDQASIRISESDRSKLRFFIMHLQRVVGGEVLITKSAAQKR